MEAAPYFFPKLQLCFLLLQAAFKLQEMLIPQLRWNDSKVSFSIVVRLLCFNSAASAYCIATVSCLGITSATNSALFPVLFYFYSCTKKYTFKSPSSKAKQGQSVTIPCISADFTSLRTSL